MTCSVMDGGLYKAGIIPTVQLIDDNGDDISNGGAEFNAAQKYLFNKEMAAVNAPTVIAFGEKMVAPVIMAFGTDEQ